MCRKYRPSSGTEGAWFIDKYCGHCIHDHPDSDKSPKCDIVMNTMAYDTDDPQYPEEWIYNEEDKPICTKFSKWDWNKDDDGNWNDPVVPDPVPDNQLTMPFIFEEIGMPKVETILDLTT